MKQWAATSLLVMALILPVVLFWLLMTRSRMRGMASAVIAVATGWALNVAWAFASQGRPTIDSSQGDETTISIATRFGWVCPLVLVFLTSLVWRFKAKRAAKS